MIVDMLSNKKINRVVTKLFIRGRKLNISVLFITQYSQYSQYHIFLFSGEMGNIITCKAIRLQKFTEFILSG